MDARPTALLAVPLLAAGARVPSRGVGEDAGPREETAFATPIPPPVPTPIPAPESAEAAARPDAIGRPALPGAGVLVGSDECDGSCHGLVSARSTVSQDVGGRGFHSRVTHLAPSEGRGS